MSSCARAPRSSSANSINLGRLLPQSVYYAATSLAMLARVRRARLIHRAERQSRQRARLPVGAPARTADRRGGAGAQCQSRGAGLPRERGVAAAAEHRDARLGHGRRRSEQHGAAARAVPGAAQLRARGERLLGDRCSRSARASASVTRSTARSGARTRRPRRRPGSGSRRSAARAVAGCWWRRRIRRSFREIVEPLIGRAVPVPPSLAALFARAECRVPRSMPTWRHCARLLEERG